MSAQTSESRDVREGDRCTCGHDRSWHAGKGGGRCCRGDRDLVGAEEAAKVGGRCACKRFVLGGAKVDLDARMRGLALHWIRFYWVRRHDDRNPCVRADVAREKLREEIAQLRSLGPGRVEPVETCGGRTSVPETTWGVS